MTTSRRHVWGWGIAGAILVAVVVAAAVLASHPAPRHDPSTPEGTVQAFLQAVLDDDTDTAAEYLADDDDPRCLDDRFGDPDTSIRASLVSTDVDDRRAEVRVRLTFARPEPPFGGSEYSEDVTFRLESDGDGWRIVSAGWPYPCIERIPAP